MGFCQGMNYCYHLYRDIYEVFLAKNLICSCLEETSSSYSCVPMQLRKLGRPAEGKDISPFAMKIWVFPEMVVPQNGWFIMENPIKMNDLGVPLFSETSIYAFFMRKKGEKRYESLGDCLGRVLRK